MCLLRERDGQTANILGWTKTRYITHAKTVNTGTTFASCSQKFSIVTLLLLGEISQLCFNRNINI
jgi:hypothetical protein